MALAVAESFEAMQHRWDVFVSYNGADRNRAKHVVEDLRRGGLDIWFDREQVRGGDRIREKINEGISGSRLVMVILSRRSLESRWVLNELDAAMMREIDENRKVVILMLVGNIDPAEIPKDLKGKNFFDCRHNFERRYQSQRNEILAATQQWVQYVSDGYEIIPHGSAIMQRIMKFGYSANQDEMMRILVDTLAEMLESEDFWRASFGADSPFEVVEHFVAEFGQFGIEQLVMFFVDHSEGMIWKTPISEKMLSKFASQAKVFIVMYGLARRFKYLGKMPQPPFVFYLKPNYGFGFGMWPGAKYTTDADGRMTITWPTVT